MTSQQAILVAMGGDDDEIEDRHLPEFKGRLAAWRAEVQGELDAARASLREGDGFPADALDRAASEAARTLALRAKDRQTKLVAGIDAALKRIADGTYGICAVTGDPMTLGRLRARPIATMCVEAQAMHERGERVARL